MTSVQVGQQAYQPELIAARAGSARGWFLAIIVFSLINSVLIWAHANVTFMMGLGVTQAVDAVCALLGKEMGGGAASIMPVVGLLLNLIPLGILAVIWWLSGTGNSTAYAVGMVLYLLDGLLFLLAMDWIGIAFHAYFLYRLYAGYQFVKAYREAQAALAAPPAEAVGEAT